MSRSYKKNPIIKENRRGSNKKAKRIANSTLRMKTKNGIDIGQNNEYKKHFDSWNISDYCIRTTKEDAIKAYEEYCLLEYYLNKNYPMDLAIKVRDEFLKDYPTVEAYLKWWRKYYKNK